MRNSIFLLLTILFISCNENNSNTKEQTTVDTSNIQKTDTVITENKIPKAEELKLTPLENSSNLGVITFTQNQKTVFYFNVKSNGGLINLNSKSYSLNKYEIDRITNTYTLTGNGVTIVAANCKYKENEGSDCNYGTIASVTIKLNTSVLNIKNVEVQDCPDY